MKKILLIIAVLITTTSFAQTANPILAANQENFNNTVFQTTDISSDMPSVTGSNNNCVNGWIVTGYIFAFSGGALLGWSLGSAVSGQEVNPYVIAGGAGLVGLAFVFEAIGKKNCRGFAYQPLKKGPSYVKDKREHNINLMARGNTVGFSLQL